MNQMFPREEEEQKLTEEWLQADQAADEVIEVNREVWLTVAGDDYLMQRTVEQEPCGNAALMTSALSLAQTMTLGFLCRLVKSVECGENDRLCFSFLTCFLHSHPHLRGAHTSTLVCIPPLVQILTKDQTHAIPGLLLNYAAQWRVHGEE